nr:mechanosensitive ion channel [candidate division KSB1 bacterium]NIT72389.1 mechanosensitive ion channel [candidate division KSB1 bacterium]NIV07204.1 mechanosensitive ion channel [candidate division Zixibacteria bacterium]NIX72069.1 mechanosensitive ion channel [candidate division KSB1 bacterium]
RIDVRVSVAYKEDIARVREVLQDVAQKNPLCLQEPEPLFIFSGFGNSSIDLTFAVWAVREDWLKVKNQIYEQIKKRFDEEGIEIPFPHLSFYTGLASKPLPIEIVNKNENFLNAEPEMNSNV